MTETAVVGEILDGATEIDKYIEIGQRAQRGTCQQRFSTLPARGAGAGNAGTQNSLSQRIHI